MSHCASRRGTLWKLGPRRIHIALEQPPETPQGRPLQPQSEKVRPRRAYKSPGTCGLRDCPSAPEGGVQRAGPFELLLEWRQRFSSDESSARAHQTIVTEVLGRTCQARIDCRLV